MLDLRRLSIFVAVVEEGSFTGAAHRLYMTQSAVSQQMSALERESGVPLFRRLPRGVELTSAGDVLVVRARALLADSTAIEQELHRLGAGTPEVRLATFVSAGVDLLPQAVRAFTARRPDVRLVVRPSSGEPLALLRDGTMDAILMWDYDFDPTPPDPTFTQSFLLEDPLFVVLPMDHPLADRPSVAIADLASEKWVTRAHRASYGGPDPYEKMFRIAGFEADVVFAAADYQSLQGLVAAGVGVSMAPRLSLSPHRPDVVVRPTVAPAFARRITVWTLPAATRTSPVDDLIEVLHQVADDMTENS